MIIKKFKVSALRTVTSPSSKDITTYFAWVDFRDLPAGLSLELNPQKPEMNTPVARQLLNAVTDVGDGDFDIDNSGIVVTAKQVKFDTNTNEVVLNLGDDVARYGVLDGGHTYTAIISKRDKLPADVKKFVRLEIVVGKDLDVARLADARHTSVQVGDITYFDLNDKFHFIESAIANEPYAKNVAYTDIDNKEISIVDLLKLLFVFNIKRYPDDHDVPLSAYSEKMAVLRDYKNEAGQADNFYKKLAPQLVTLVNLYEKIQKEFPAKFKAFKAEVGVPFSGTVRGMVSGNDFVSDFNQEKIDCQISAGFLFPIFGAFRALLKENSDGVLEWQFDPSLVWKKVGLRLVQNTFETNANPQQAGLSKTLWQANYRIVDNARKDLLLESLLTN